MTNTVQDLYTAYAELERMPAVAAEQEKAAAAALEEARKAGKVAVAQSEKDFRGQKAALEQQHTASRTALQQRLDTLLASAAKKGSRPASGAQATGAAPAFDAVTVQDAELGRLLDERTRFAHELGELRELLQREGDMRRAKRNDRITLAIAGIGAVVVCVAGANAVGAIAALVTALVIQFRLGRGSSAFMLKRSVRVPALVHDRRRRSGQTRLIGGLFIILAMLIGGVVGWVLEFWQSLRTSYADILFPPEPTLWTTLTAGWLAWFGAALGLLYGVLLTFHGARRLRGR